MLMTFHRNKFILTYFFKLDKCFKDSSQLCSHTFFKRPLSCQTQKVKKEGCFLSSQNKYVHTAMENTYENLFQVKVIELDMKGNSEAKYLRLDTLINELRATEKAKLDKLLSEISDQDLYAWNDEKRALERKSINSREYRKQRRSQLPIRDLRMFFRHIKLSPKQTDHLEHHQVALKRTEHTHIHILPRASADCFLLEIEHIKLLCKKDRCIVLEPRASVKNGEDNSKIDTNESMAEMTAIFQFVNDLKRNLKASSAATPTAVEEMKRNDSESIQDDDEGYDKYVGGNYNAQDQAFLSFILAGKGNVHNLPFELIVLETAFSNVISKLRRHQALMLPLLDVLIHDTLSANPPTRMMLRRTLAFKQNLAKFENKVYTIRDAVRNILSNDQDMADLYLSSISDGEKNDESDHEEVELLLEAYAADLNQISSEVSRMKAALDDTDDFVDTHLSTMRNKIIRLSLFMDMGMFSLGFAALAAGIGGMNMTHGLEEHPYAFYVTCGCMAVCTSTLFSILYGRYRLLDSDTSEARMRHYYALKNYLSVLDEVEARLKIRSEKDLDGDYQNENIGDTNYVTKEQFGDVLRSVVNAQPDEIDLIFKSFDADRSGVLEINELSEDHLRKSEKSGINKIIYDTSKQKPNSFLRRLKRYKNIER